MDKTTKEPLKKFPHSTRQIRRLDKALLEDDEIDYRKLPIRDFILMQLYQEQLAKKEATTSEVGTAELDDANVKEDFAQPQPSLRGFFSSTIDKTTKEPRKKIPHSTRGIRRLDKALVENDKLDHRKFPIRDIILMQLYQEQLAKKEATTSKTSPNPSWAERDNAPLVDDLPFTTEASEVVADQNTANFPKSASGADSMHLFFFNANKRKTFLRKHGSSSITGHKRANKPLNEDVENDDVLDPPYNSNRDKVEDLTRGTNEEVGIAEQEKVASCNS